MKRLIVIVVMAGLSTGCFGIKARREVKHLSAEMTEMKQEELMLLRELSATQEEVTKLESESRRDKEAIKNLSAKLAEKVEETPSTIVIVGDYLDPLQKCKEAAEKAGQRNYSLQITGNTVTCTIGFR